MKLRLFFLAVVLSSSSAFQFSTKSVGVNVQSTATEDYEMGRRKWMATSFAVMAGGASLVAVLPVNANDYENPEMPEVPEERSGLVVLRVAEVCNFQEKILRAVVSKDIDTVVSPQQIVFGTQLLLRNSNIAGNMKLMIETEVEKEKRKEAAISAAIAMNTIQSISTTSAKIQRPFTNDEMLEVADLYRVARVQLNNIYEYLPQNGKDKYYGYFMKVTEYEKKIAEGTYNPELDGVLKLDYD